MRSHTSQDCQWNGNISLQSKSRVWKLHQQCCLVTREKEAHDVLNLCGRFCFCRYDRSKLALIGPQHEGK